MLCYVTSQDGEQIKEMSGYSTLAVGDIYEVSTVGMTDTARIAKLKIYGENYINVPVKSVIVIFLQVLALN